MKKIILSCFLIFSGITSVFAIDPPDFSKIKNGQPPYHPFVLSNEEIALIRQRANQDGLVFHLGLESDFREVQEVISLTGYNVEYRRAVGKQADIRKTIRKILSGKKKALVILPVTSATPFTNGLTIAPESLDPSNQVGMVISRDRILEDLPKVPKGFRTVYIYFRQPGMASSGTNQLLIEAANRGIPAGVAVLGGNRQVFKDVIELLPYAAAQIREGANPIQLDLFGNFGFQPQNEEENDGWLAAIILTKVLGKYPSLRIPQVTIQPYRVQPRGAAKDLILVKDNKWLDSNRWLSVGTSLFEHCAIFASIEAENYSDRSPSLEELRWVALGSAEVIAFNVLNEAMQKPVSNSKLSFGSLPFAVRAIEQEAKVIRLTFMNYEKIRGPVEK